MDSNPVSCRSIARYLLSNKRKSTIFIRKIRYSMGSLMDWKSRRATNLATHLPFFGRLECVGHSFAYVAHLYL
jgi:hypothetical protein